MMQYSDQLKAAGAWLLSAVAGIGTGILQFVASIIIAGVLLAYSTSVGNAATKIFIKLVGKNGENFASTTVITVRSVVKGILGVAVIQATMAGLGFFIAGVPYAGCLDCGLSVFCSYPSWRRTGCHPGNDLYVFGNGYANCCITGHLAGNNTYF